MAAGPVEDICAGDAKPYGFLHKLLLLYRLISLKGMGVEGSRTFCLKAGLQPQNLRIADTVNRNDLECSKSLTRVLDSFVYQPHRDKASTVSKTPRLLCPRWPDAINMGPRAEKLSRCKNRVIRDIHLRKRDIVNKISHSRTTIDSRATRNRLEKKPLSNSSAFACLFWGSISTKCLLFAHDSVTRLTCGHFQRRSQDRFMT